MLATHSIWD